MRPIRLHLPVLVSLFAGGCAANIDSGDSKDGDQGQSLERLEQLADEYSIEIRSGEFNLSLSESEAASWRGLDESDRQTLEEYANILSHEWRKYPRDWVLESNLREIVLVSDLVVVGQARAAMPDTNANVLYLDVSYVHDPTYAAYVIHHEYFHLIEEERFGDVYYADPEWVRLNPEDFEYGTGGATAYEDGGDYASREHPRTGFVTGYATYGPEEDKAEVYAWMFSPEKYSLLRTWMAEDSALAAKTELLQAYFAEVTGEPASFFDEIE